MSYDAEKIVADYLREETGARMVALPPEDRTPSWVQLVEINAPQAPDSPVDHLVAHNLQLDCYAGAGQGPPHANALAGQIRDALTALRNKQRDGVVITRVRIDGSHRDWDTEMKPARDRRILTATVWMHPS